MASLITTIRENPKLAPVAAALNEDRLMLREAGSPPAPPPLITAPPMVAAMSSVSLSSVTVTISEEVQS
jgi:hypothetical protein